MVMMGGNGDGGGGGGDGGDGDGDNEMTGIHCAEEKDVA